MHLSSGEISDMVFSLLCRLDDYDLADNPGLGQNTLAGHLAVTMKNLKDEKSIDASGLKLKGVGAGNSSVAALHFADFPPPTFFAGRLPKELGKLVDLKSLDVSENDLSGSLRTRAEHFKLFVC